MQEGPAQRELQACRKLIASREYSIAIPRLVNTISSYSNTDAALEAHYWLGIAYGEIHSYRDAIDILSEYLRLAPKGAFAGKVTAKLDALKKEYTSKFDTPEALDKKISDIEAQLRNRPDALDLQLELADLLWRRGDYAPAGRTYVHILNQHPEYATDPKISARIERQPNGDYVTLTPLEVQRRAVRSSPLQITNETSFQSGRDPWTHKNKFYVVTGQAVNQSDSVLYNVRVDVTIYGFGSVIYGTHAANLGRLNPGETRAFSVRFSDFDNIENVLRYECVGSFGD